MLRFCRIRATRSSGVAPLPNRRSNTTCGLSSIGSGLVQRHRLAGRRRQVDPRDGIRVGAAVAFAAVARARVRVFDGQLQRRQQRFLPDLSRDDLIDRRAADGRIRPGRLPRLDAGQERRRHPVIGAGRAFRRFRRLRPDAAQDDGLVLDVLERLQDVRQLVGQRTLLLRLPVAGRHSVREEDAHEAALRSGGGLRERRGRRNHRLEQRQRQRHAGAAEKRPAPNVFFGDDTS